MDTNDAACDIKLAEALKDTEMCKCSICLERLVMSVSESDDILLKIDSWTKLRELVPGIYTNLAECEKLDDNIKDHLTRLICSDPHLFFQRIESDLRNHINECKSELLKQLSCGYRTPKCASNFVCKMLDAFSNLVNSADSFSSVMHRVDCYDFSDFDEMWSQLNKCLFQNMVFSEPTIHRILPELEAQLQKGMMETDTETSRNFIRTCDRFKQFHSDMIELQDLSQEPEQFISRFKSLHIGYENTCRLLHRSVEDQKIVNSLPTYIYHNSQNPIMSSVHQSGSIHRYNPLLSLSNIVNDRDKSMELLESSEEPQGMSKMFFTLNPYPHLSQMQAPTHFSSTTTTSSSHAVTETTMTSTSTSPVVSCISKDYFSHIRPPSVHSDDTLLSSGSDDDGSIHVIEHPNLIIPPDLETFDPFGNLLDDRDENDEVEQDDDAGDSPNFLMQVPYPFAYSSQFTSTRGSPESHASMTCSFSAPPYTFMSHSPGLVPLPSTQLLLPTLGVPCSSRPLSSTISPLSSTGIVLDHHEETIPSQTLTEMFKQEEMHIIKSVQPPSLSNVVHVSNAVQSNGEGSVTLNNCHTFDFQPNLAFSLCDMEKKNNSIQQDIIEEDGSEIDNDEMRGNEDYDDADDEEEDENDDEAQKCGCNQCTSVLHNVIHHKSNEETTAQMFCDKATSNYVIASNSAFLSPLLSSAPTAVGTCNCPSCNQRYQNKPNLNLYYSSIADNPATYSQQLSANSGAFPGQSPVSLLLPQPHALSAMQPPSLVHRHLYSPTVLQHTFSSENSMFSVANNTYSPNMPDGKKGSETPLSNGLLLYQPFDSVQQTFSASASQPGCSWLGHGLQHQVGCGSDDMRSILFNTMPNPLTERLATDDKVPPSDNMPMNSASSEPSFKCSADNTSSQSPVYHITHATSNFTPTTSVASSFQFSAFNQGLRQYFHPGTAITHNHQYGPEKPLADGFAGTAGLQPNNTQQIFSNPEHRYNPFLTSGINSQLACDLVSIYSGCNQLQQPSIHHPTSLLAKNSFGFPSVVHQTPSTSTVADGKTSAAIAATTASIQQQIQRRKKLVAHGKLGRQQNQKKALNSVHANAPVLHDSASAFGKKQEEMNCQQTTTANQPWSIEKSQLHMHLKLQFQHNQPSSTQENHATYQHPSMPEQVQQTATCSHESGLETSHDVIDEYGAQNHSMPVPISVNFPGEHPPPPPLSPSSSMTTSVDVPDSNEVQKSSPHKHQQCTSTNSCAQNDAVTKNSETNAGSSGGGSKYCDCCYCEFFGNGGPPQAPTSKNYPEMRERLRLKLNKKMKVDNREIFNNSDSSDYHQSRQHDDRSLEEILSFIEGSEKQKALNKKNKRARQKLRKKEEGNTATTEIKHDVIAQDLCSEKLATSKHNGVGANSLHGSIHTDCTQVENSEVKKAHAKPNGTPIHKSKAEGKHQSLNGQQKREDECIVKSESRKITVISADKNGVKVQNVNDRNQNRMNEPKKEGRTPRKNSPLHSKSLHASFNNMSITDSNLMLAKTKKDKTRDSTSKDSGPVQNKQSSNQAIKTLKQGRSKKSKGLEDGMENSTHTQEMHNSSRMKTKLTNGIGNNSGHHGLRAVNNKNCIIESIPNSHGQPSKAVSDTTHHQSQPISNKKNKNKKKANSLIKTGDGTHTDLVFLPKDDDIEPSEMDDIEKEIDSFKRFCLDTSSIVRERKKVSVNWKEISFKKNHLSH